MRTRRLLTDVGARRKSRLPGASSVHLRLVQDWSIRRRCFWPDNGRGRSAVRLRASIRANNRRAEASWRHDIISISACGSFRRECLSRVLLHPKLLVGTPFRRSAPIARRRAFFGNGCVGYVSMAPSVAPRLADAVSPRRGPPRISPAISAEPMHASKGRNSLSLADRCFSVRGAPGRHGMTGATEAKLCPARPRFPTRPSR